MGLTAAMRCRNPGKGNVGSKITEDYGHLGLALLYPTYVTLTTFICFVYTIKIERTKSAYISHLIHKNNIDFRGFSCIMKMIVRKMKMGEILFSFSGTNS